MRTPDRAHSAAVVLYPPESFGAAAAFGGSSVSYKCANGEGLLYGGGGGTRIIIIITAFNGTGVKR